MTLVAILVIVVRTALAITALWHMVSFVRYFGIEDATRESEDKKFRQYLITGFLVIVLAIVEALIATTTLMWVVVVITVVFGFILD